MPTRVDGFSISPIWVERFEGLRFDLITSVSDINLFISNDHRIKNTVSRIYLSKTCEEVFLRKKCKEIASDDFLSLLLEKYIFYTFEKPSDYYEVLRSFILFRCNPVKHNCLINSKQDSARRFSNDTGFAP